jgi:2-keto-3-deoxy-6-phosphogluconate aldolase
MPTGPSRQTITDRILDGGAVAVVRMDEAEHAVRVVEAIRAGGGPPSRSP